MLMICFDQESDVPYGMRDYLLFKFGRAKWARGGNTHRTQFLQGQVSNFFLGKNKLIGVDHHIGQSNLIGGE